MRIDSSQIESIPKGHEISVLLSTENEQGSYTFLISDTQWAGAVARGPAKSGSEAIDEALPWLIAGKKSMVSA